MMGKTTEVFGKVKKIKYDTESGTIYVFPFTGRAKPTPNCHRLLIKRGVNVGEVSGSAVEQQVTVRFESPHPNARMEYEHGENHLIIYQRKF